MNCTKVTSPLPILVDIGYYFSTFILILCFAIAPLQFYIILTRSKNLKLFKWYILNHSIWCLLFESLYCLTKFVMFPPAYAYYPIGITRNFGFTFTIATAHITATVVTIYCASLSATLVVRYMLAFPTAQTKFLNEKTLFIGYIIPTTIDVIMGVYSYSNRYYDDPSTFYEAALEYDPCFQYYITHEPGFVFIPMTKHLYVVSMIIWIILIIGIIGAGILLGRFIYLVTSQKSSQILKKLQRSLMISAAVQLSNIMFLLVFPAFFGVTVIHYQIKNAENISVILFWVVSCHSLFESLSTLYFVAPYREGVKEIAEKILPFIFKKKSNTVQISQVAAQSENISYGEILNRRI